MAGKQNADSTELDSKTIVAFLMLSAREHPTKGRRGHHNVYTGSMIIRWAISQEQLPPRKSSVPSRTLLSPKNGTEIRIGSGGKRRKNNIVTKICQSLTV